MAIKTPEEVILAFIKWTALKDGTSTELALKDLNDEPKIREAFTKLVELAREGVRDAALEEAAELFDAKAWPNTARIVRALKGGA